MRMFFNGFAKKQKTAAVQTICTAALKFDLN